MANVSKTVKRIVFDDLVFDGNPRTKKGMKLEQMIASFVTHGYQPDSTILVEEKQDGQFLVLRGNRRSLAALELQKQDQETFDRIFSDGKIPAFVAKGISDQERILLRIDHSTELDREPLDDEGLFNAVCQLLRASLNQREIAAHLNLFTKNNKTGDLEPNRSLVQRRAELAKLPGFVQDEYRILMRKGKDVTAVRWSMIPGLYKMYSKTSVEYPDGNMEFNEKWELCKTFKDDLPEGSVSVKLTPKKAKDFSELAQSKGVRDILLSVTGQIPTTFENVDLAILAGEQATATLVSIQDHLGKDAYNDLIARSLNGGATDDQVEVEAEASTVEA